jgi:hypothetical protein
MNAIKNFARRNPKTTYVIVFALGGISALSFGAVAKILAPAASAVASVKGKVSGG